MIPIHHAVSFQRLLWDDQLNRARTIIDLTCGNGHDVEYLAHHCCKDSHIYAIDIQETALNEAKKRVNNPNVSYILGSHDIVLEKDSLIPRPFDLVVANLGYLPKGNHTIHTKPATTVKALQTVTEELSEHGLCTIIAYPGTPLGMEEKYAVESYISTLSQKEYDVCTWQPMNQINNPPLLYVIRRRSL